MAKATVIARVGVVVMLVAGCSSPGPHLVGGSAVAGPAESSAAPTSAATSSSVPVQIDPAVSRTIPLHYRQLSVGAGRVVPKHGINVAIGNNPPQMYSFDTGGLGFFPGYSPNFWHGVTLGTQPVEVRYGSGDDFNAVATTTPITSGDGPDSVTTGPIQIGAIQHATDPRTGKPYDFTNPNAGPFSAGFFGNFGANFNILPVPGRDQGLTSALFQLPGMLASGFLVHLGPVGQTQPTLTVGITDALRAQFPYAIPVDAAGGSYPVSGLPALKPRGIAAQYSVTGPGSGSPTPVATLPTLLDTGSPSTVLRPTPGAEMPFAGPRGHLMPGTTFTAEFPTAEGRPPLRWSFVAGAAGAGHEVNYAPSEQGRETAIAGLDLFNDFDVMFDVAKGVIRLRPIAG